MYHKTEWLIETEVTRWCSLEPIRLRSNTYRVGQQKLRRYAVYLALILDCVFLFGSHIYYISIPYRTIVCQFLFKIYAKFSYNLGLNLHYYNSAVVQFLLAHPVWILLLLWNPASAFVV